MHGTASQQCRARFQEKGYREKLSKRGERGGSRATGPRVPRSARPFPCPEEHGSHVERCALPVLLPDLPSKSGGLSTTKPCPALPPCLTAPAHTESHRPGLISYWPCAGSPIHIHTQTHRASELVYDSPAIPGDLGAGHSLELALKICSPTSVLCGQSTT